LCRLVGLILPLFRFESTVLYCRVLSFADCVLVGWLWRLLIVGLCVVRVDGSGGVVSGLFGLVGVVFFDISIVCMS
jgi:hypothetical protein